MWEGYIDFFFRLKDGDISAWWYQHNEHRPIFSRVLFYIDLEYFGGLSKSLIPINILFVIAIWYMLILYVLSFFSVNNNSYQIYYLIVLITVCVFSWKQEENITWAFQSQFWAAYLFPLVAFYHLGESVKEGCKQNIHFVTACMFGILSSITMANGILVLPVLTVMSIIQNKSITRSIILVFFAVLTTYLFMLNYHTPEQHNSITENILAMPVQTMVFLVEYIGSPPKNIYASFIFGLFHIYLMVMIVKKFSTMKNNSHYLSVVAFLTYYVGTAVVIAGSRVDLGIKSALVSRYTTPTLIAVCLSIMLYLHCYPRHFKFLNKKTVTFFAVIMMATQIRTVIKNVDKLHDGDYIQAMALELGLHHHKKFQSSADRATDENISIFALELFYNKREMLGKGINKVNCKNIKYKFGSQNNRSGNEFTTIEVFTEYELPEDTVLYLINKYEKIIGIGFHSRNEKGKGNIVIPDKISLTDDSLVYTCS